MIMEAGTSKLPLREVLAALSIAPPLRTLRDDLYHLKRLGLIGTRGYGRGAVWFLIPDGEG